MTKVSALWRYPIKSHGREALTKIDVKSGQTLPGDRLWAVAHEAAKTDGGNWVPCANFSRGAKAPGLMALSSSYDEAAGTVTLSHPNQGTFTFDPDGDATDFLNWIRPLTPKDRAQSASVVRADANGMTDTPFASISLIGKASLNALSERLEQLLAPERFRANIWIDGTEPFQEFNWIGKTVQIGTTTFEVAERITRCLATTANPATGERDADTLGGLEAGWGHKDLGIYLRATTDGGIALSDTLQVI